MSASPARRWATWAAAAALLAAAWAIGKATPPEDAREAPFVVAGAIGETVEGRNIAVTVDEVRRARTVSAGEWSATGNWIVVDVVASSRVSSFGTLLGLAELVVADETYRASERPDSLFRHPLAADVPIAGGLAFELPADAAATGGILRLGIDSDDRLDSVVEIPLSAVVDVDATELRPVEWVGRR